MRKPFEWLLVAVGIVAALVLGLYGSFWVLDHFLATEVFG
jgi:hypothetical protein